MRRLKPNPEHSTPQYLSAKLVALRLRIVADPARAFRTAKQAKDVKERLAEARLEWASLRAGGRARRWAGTPWTTADARK